MSFARPIPSRAVRVVHGLPAHRQLEDAIAGLIGALERRDPERYAQALGTLATAVHAARRESLIVAARGSTGSIRLAAQVDAARYTHALERLATAGYPDTPADRAELLVLVEDLVETTRA